MKKSDTMLTCNLVHIMGFQSTHTGPLFRLPLHGSNISIMIISTLTNFISLQNVGVDVTMLELFTLQNEYHDQNHQMYSADQARPDVVTTTQRQSSGWPCYHINCIIMQLFATYTVMWERECEMIQQSNKYIHGYILSTKREDHYIVCIIN